MKKLLLLISLLTAAVTGAMAQSRLRISLSDNSRINIAVNGRYFGRQGQSITVGDLPPGRQYVKIYAVTTNRGGRSYDALVYQGYVRTRPGTTTRLEYDPYTRHADVQDMPMYQDAPRYPPRTDAHDDYSDTYNDDGTRRQPITNNNSNGNNSDNDDNATTRTLPPGTPVASPAGAGSKGTLTDSKLQKLKTKAEAKKTDTERLPILKDGLRGEQPTTYQVSALMDCLIFETSKLDLATWAYPSTADKEFYTDLLAKLSNKSNKDELERVIRSKR